MLADYRRNHKLITGQQSRIKFADENRLPGGKRREKYTNLLTGHLIGATKITSGKGYTVLQGKK